MSIFVTKYKGKKTSQDVTFIIIPFLKSTKMNSFPSQKNKFSLPDNVTYLNCAYMGPLLQTVEAAGIEGLKRKSQPYQVSPANFFSEVEELKKLYARLLNIDESQRIVVVPSTSYGLANAAKNSPINKGQNIVVLDEQFPSNIYTWQRVADEKDAEVRFVNAPKNIIGRGKAWNEAILQAIDNHTAVVAIPHVHWADGTKYDLKIISEKVHSVGGLLIIDGTQSVGALPFDVAEIKPDALVCGGYKWLLGGYSFGLAYYGEIFDNGTPLEENWMNRLDSENFRGLVNYQPKYKSFANRYAVGQQSNFINTPMAIAALEQILEWTPEGIQNYAQSLIKEPIEILKNLGCDMEDMEFRGNHLLGVHLPEHINLEKLQSRFAEEKVIVSVRGSAIRISTHTYNEVQDFEKLLGCFG
jgi:selenocysteine lyase/cysteine desulfurase